MYVLDCDHTCSVGYLKRMVEEVSDIPTASQILVYNDTFLMDVSNHDDGDGNGDGDDDGDGDENVPQTIQIQTMSMNILY
jgi:hypothetical protein